MYKKYIKKLKNIFSQLQFKIYAHTQMVLQRSSCLLYLTNMSYGATVGASAANSNLRGFDPLLLFFMNEIKIVSYSFS